MYCCLLLFKKSKSWSRGPWRGEDKLRALKEQEVCARSICMRERGKQCKICKRDFYLECLWAMSLRKEVITVFFFLYCPLFTSHLHQPLTFAQYNSLCHSLIQVLREINKTLSASLVHFLLTDLLVKLHRFIPICILDTLSMNLSLALPFGGSHEFPCSARSVSCAVMPHFTAVFLKQNCNAYTSSSTFTAHSSPLPKTPNGAVSCLWSLWKKEELRETWLTFNRIAYGEEKNKKAILTFTKLNG